MHSCKNEIDYPQLTREESLTLLTAVDDLIF